MDNIDQLINDMYDYIYKNKIEDFEINNIDITLENIKITKPSELLIKSIFNDKIKHIIYCLFKRYPTTSDNYSSTLIFNTYNNESKKNVLTSSDNIDKVMSYVLSELIVKKQLVNHILLPILNLDVDIEKISDILKNNKEMSYCVGDKKILNLSIKEHFFSIVSLKKAIETFTVYDWKILFFQLIFTLVNIQQIYPSFRHNNLNVNNISIYTLQEIDKCDYNYNDNKFIIKNCKFIIKIHTFNKSYIKNLVENDDISDQLKEQNQYLDFFIFIKSFDNLNLLPKNDSDFLVFFNKIMPQKNKIIYLAELLFDSYFSDFHTENYNINKLKVIKKIKEINKEDVKEKMKEEESKEEIKEDVKEKMKEEESKEEIKEDVKEKMKEESKEDVKEKMKEDESKEDVKEKMKEDESKEDVKKDEKEEEQEDATLRTKITNMEDVIDEAIRKNDNDEILKEEYINKDVTESYENILLQGGEYKGKNIDPEYYKKFKQNKFKSIQSAPPVKKENLNIVKTYSGKEGNFEKQTPIIYGIEPPYITSGLNVNKYTILQPPMVIKNINVKLPEPLDMHAKMFDIFEDAEIPKNLQNNTTMLENRLEIYNYIRSSFIKENDGELIGISKNEGQRNLFSYLKLYELNPYATIKDENPYINLPNNMLLYKACYPIRYKNNNIQCSDESMNINVRLYKMNIAESAVNLFTEGYKKFNIWRELSYYIYIKENILKRKIIPTFPLLYCYFISTNKDIKFDELQKVKERKTNISQKIKIHEYIPTKNINDLLFDIPSDLNIYDKIKLINIVKKIIDENRIIYKKEDIKKLEEYEQTLISITESPDMSLINWSTKVYDKNNIVNIVKNIGYINPEIWKNIIFQLLCTFYIMYKNKFAFENFGIENIFIKKIRGGKGFWIYNINGIDFYVKNFDHLIFIDSLFSDKNIDLSKPYKIYSKFFNDDENNINKLLKNQMNEIFSANLFNNKDIIKPSGDIIILLQNINKNLNISNEKYENVIIETLVTCFGEYLNNRIGTLLNIHEMKFIIPTDKNFEHGDMVVYEIQPQLYKFAMYIGNEISNDAINNVNINMSKILTILDDKNIELKIITRVPTGSLSKYYYTEIQPIEQNIIFPNDRSIDSFIEKYTL